MTAAHKPSTRFAATIDAETSVLYQRAERALVSANPALEGEITPTMMLRQGLRAIVALYGGGGAGASPPTPASSPSSAAPAPTPSPVEAPPPVAAPVQVQPPPAPAARVEAPAVEDKPRSTRVDRSAKAPKAKAAAKPARPSTRGKAPAPHAPDPRQLGIPGADGIASSGGKGPAPAVEGKARRVAASPDDVERIARYLATPGALGALALSKRAGVPGAKTSLFSIVAARRQGQPLPGLSASNAAALLASINELPRAQSAAAAVARGSQGEETPTHG